MLWFWGGIVCHLFVEHFPSCSYSSQRIPFPPTHVYFLQRKRAEFTYYRISIKFRWSVLTGILQLINKNYCNRLMLPCSCIPTATYDIISKVILIIWCYSSCFSCLTVHIWSNNSTDGSVYFFLSSFTMFILFVCIVKYSHKCFSLHFLSYHFSFYSKMDV